MNKQTFEYQLLARLKQDCEFYLNWGNGNSKYLWADNVPEQITKMKELYSQLTIKPEWLTLEQITQYEHAMLNHTPRALPLQEAIQ